MSNESGPFFKGQLSQQDRDARDIAEAQATRSGGTEPLDNDFWAPLTSTPSPTSGEIVPSRRSHYDLGDADE